MGDRRGREQPWRAPLYPVCAHSSPSECGCKPDRQGLNDETCDFVYQCYVSSPLLDDRVRSERTSFNIEEEPSPLFEANEVSLDPADESGDVLR